VGQLAVARVHHATADLELRERFSALAAAAPVAPDLLPVLTCHRAEVYAVVEGGMEPRSWFDGRLGPLPLAVQIASDEEAVRHLFRVASGLDSAIPGERQILGQLRAAYDRCRADGTRSELAGLFERALHVGRSLRATTALGKVTTSLGSLAVAAALARIAEPARATVVVVGAGEMGKLASRSLAMKVAELVVVNRDVARALPLADAAGGAALPLGSLPELLQRADALISAADTRGELLTLDLLAGPAERGLVVVDIAMPRSVAADARAALGPLYLTVDDLIPEEQLIGDVERDTCEDRCSQEAASFLAAVRGRAAGETIARLRERAESQRQARLGKALGDLGHLSERDRRVIETFSHALTNALMHEPISSLREEPDRVPAARELFRL